MNRNVATLLIAVLMSALLFAQEPDKTPQKNESAAAKDSSISEVTPAQKEAPPKDVSEKENASLVVDSAQKGKTANEPAIVKDSSSTVKEASDGTVDSSDSGTTGILTIVTVPESAFVVFDEIVRGKSPYTITDIPVGKHSLILKKKGHFAKKATINVTAGSENELTFKLIKPVHLSITSEPLGAVVLINKEQVGKTPYADSKRKPGTCEIILAMEGYKKERHSVTLNSGEQDSIHVTLVPQSPVTGDTTASADKKESKKERSKLASILDKVALGVFIGFSAIILIIELTQDK